MSKKITRCPYCKQPVKQVGKKQVIFHLFSCEPAKNYIKSKRKYQVEVEMPDISHGGYI